MKNLHRSTVSRLVAFLCAFALVFQTGSATIESAVKGFPGFWAKLTGQKRAPYTDRPGVVYKGAQPGRDEFLRGGFYTPATKSAIGAASQKWSQAGGFEGLFAMALGEAAPALWSGQENGGPGLPGEGTRSGAQVGGGIVNTYNGNMLKSYTLTGWPAKGGMSIEFTLYYNSQTTYNVELGHNWSSNYGAKLDVANAGQSNEIVTIRYGDGTTVAYAKSGSVYTRPAGIFDDLTKLGSGNYLVTTHSGVKIEFNPPKTSPSGDQGDIVSITDRNGYSISMTYGTHGGKESLETIVEDAIPDRSITLSYVSSSSRIETITDPSGRTWTLTYDGSARLTGIEQPPLNTYSHSVTFGYEDGSDPYALTSEANLNSNTWTYEYDSGKLEAAYPPEPYDDEYLSFAYTSTATTITNPDASRTKHTVDNYSSGLLASQVDEAGYSVAYLDYTNRLPQTIRDKAWTSGNAHKWEFTYDSNGNVLTATSHPTGSTSNTTTCTYNSANDLLTSINGAQSHAWTYTYDSNGNLLTVTDPEQRLVQTNVYNGTTHLLAKSWFGGNGDQSQSYATWTEYGYNYDEDGSMVLTVTRPKTSGTISSTTAYDIMGSVSIYTDPLGKITTRSYDDWGRLVQIELPEVDYGSGGVVDTIQYAYDLMDNLITFTDERGKTTTFEYDERGRRTDVNKLYGTSTSGSGSHTNVHTDFNWRGNATEVTREGPGSPATYSKTFSYTYRGELYSMQNGDNTGEGWSYNANGQVSIHQFSMDGEQMVPDPETTDFTYDGAGRLTNVEDSVSGQYAALTYDAADRLTQMVDATGTTSWYYKADNQFDHVNAPQGNVYYYYDSYGRNYRVTDNGLTSYNMDYAFDATGRVSSVTKFGETTSFEYDDASRLTKQTYNNGTWADYGYDERSRIKSIQHYRSGPTLLAKEINTYDSASRIVQRVSGASGTYVTTDYEYDDAGQLTDEDDGTYHAAYTYDKNNNRLTRVAGGITGTYSYDAGDKLTQISYSGTGAPATKTFAYDVAGRMTTVTQSGSAIRTYAWNGQSALTYAAGSGFSTVTGTYNGMGARVTRTVSSTTTSFKRTNPDPVSPVLAEVTGSTTTRFVPGISQKSGTTSLFYHNGIKSDIAQSDTSSTPAITATKQYDAYGTQLNSTGSWSGRFQYGGDVGYQTESDAGLKLLGNRWYDPEIGRFLSRDPAHSGSNWYAYCENNPISGADPAGLLPYGVGAALKAVIIIGVDKGNNDIAHDQAVEVANWYRKNLGMPSEIVDIRDPDKLRNALMDATHIIFCGHADRLGGKIARDEKANSWVYFDAALATSAVKERGWKFKAIVIEGCSAWGSQKTRRAWLQASEYFAAYDRPIQFNFRLRSLQTGQVYMTGSNPKWNGPIYHTGGQKSYPWILKR